MNIKNDDSEASGSTAAHCDADTHGFRLLPVSEEMHRQLTGDKLQGEGVTMLEVTPSNRLFNLISRYFTVHRDKSIGGDQADSWDISLTILKTTTSAESDDDDDDAGGEADGGKMIGKTVETVELQPGLGVHEIGFQGRRIRMVHQAIGRPVSCEGWPRVHNTMVLVADGKEQQGLLKAFCDHVLAWDSEQSDQHYNVYMWKPSNMFWNKVATKRVRPIESVVLPAEVKRTVLQDLREFESRQTGRWYARHGIPYKRSLLFHGLPGAGKSSFITALAGELQRNVCFLQPAHPAITDDNLHACVQTAPANSLIVMEDVDALFSSDRASANAGKAPLTFSGLLNALDGVCNPEGQIFVLTTNHIERLDPALIRPGRVDIKVRFGTATREQAAGLFVNFYPGETELGHQFADVIASRDLKGNKDKHDKQEEPARKKRKKKVSISSAADGSGGDLEEKEKEENEDDKQEEEEDQDLGVSMAALQQLFIFCRKKSPAEAVEQARTFHF